MGAPNNEIWLIFYCTCVPGNSSFALLIIILVQEDRRSSAIVSPPFPIMWPDTLLGDAVIRSYFIHVYNSTLEPASWDGCPCPLQDVSLHCSHCQSHCQDGNTASPWMSKSWDDCGQRTGQAGKFRWCTVFWPALGRGQGTHLCHNSSLPLSPKSLWKSARLLPNEISLANQAERVILLCSCTNHSCTPLAAHQPAISKEVNDGAKEQKQLWEMLFSVHVKMLV